MLNLPDGSIINYQTETTIVNLNPSLITYNDIEGYTTMELDFKDDLKLFNSKDCRLICILDYN